MKKPPGYYPTAEELVVWTLLAVFAIVIMVVFVSIITAPFL